MISKTKLWGFAKPPRQVRIGKASFSVSLPQVLSLFRCRKCFLCVAAASVFLVCYVAAGAFFVSLPQVLSFFVCFIAAAPQVLSLSFICFVVAGAFFVCFVGRRCFLCFVAAGGSFVSLPQVLSLFVFPVAILAQVQIIAYTLP